MKKHLYLVFSLALAVLTGWKSHNAEIEPFFAASSKKFQYVGRIDFSNPGLPRFWAPGAYIRARFKGENCSITLINEGNSHNYVSIQVDDLPVKRLKLLEKSNTIKVAENLSKGIHSLVICKSTESNIGYLEFAGLSCTELLSPPKAMRRKIEFIGNSITCGTGSDVSEIPCGKGEWSDQHNAYMSYGALVARSLKSEYHLTAASGIGLMKSCCNMKVVMPQVFDKVNLRDNLIKWDFSRYQPDIVTVCLGQNDGIVDSVLFCSAYVKFLATVRVQYPRASIICLTSPMADEKLLLVQKKYLNGINTFVNSRGDKNIYNYFFSKRYHAGCDSHPSLAEHKQIAGELISCIKRIKKW